MNAPTVEEAVTTSATEDAHLLRAAYAHPIRIRTVAIFAHDDVELSPKEIARRLNHALPVVAYHVRELAQAGLLVETRTEPRRGALQHFYRRDGVIFEALRLALEARLEELERLP